LKNLIAVTAVAALFAAGCASEPIPWSRQGTTALGFVRDQEECTTKANDTYVPIATWPFGGWRIRPAVYQDCMEDRGYTKGKTTKVGTAGQTPVPGGATRP
jgi:hypothetical protein